MYFGWGGKKNYLRVFRNFSIFRFEGRKGFRCFFLMGNRFVFIVGTGF